MYGTPVLEKMLDHAETDLANEMAVPKIVIDKMKLWAALCDRSFQDRLANVEAAEQRLLNEGATP